jgi:hypothetical protein
MIAAGRVTNNLWLLHVAWAVLAIAMVSTVASFLVSKAALQDVLDKFQTGSLTDSNCKGPLNQWTEFLNWLAGGSFVLGILLAAFFFH